MKGKKILKKKADPISKFMKERVALAYNKAGELNYAKGISKLKTSYCHDTESVMPWLAGSPFKEKDFCEKFENKLERHIASLMEEAGKEGETSEEKEYEGKKYKAYPIRIIFKKEED